jgi:formimidoylglutamase
MSKIKYLTSVPLPPPPPFPDPNLTWLSRVFKEWDGMSHADAGVVGIPFDRGVVSHRQGARLGPKSVRDALYFYTDYCIEHDVVLSKLKLVDFGDVAVDVASYGETRARVESVMTDIFRTGSIPLIVGGDHSNSYPCVKGLCNNMRVGQRLGVIDFDSHHDVRAGWKENSGLWAREIQEIEGRPVRGENVVQIGVHGYVYSTVYRDFVKKSGMKIFTPLDVYKRGILEVVSEALQRASDGTDMIYVSVDIDVLDQAYAPGTNAPFPGGLTTRELTTAIFEIAKHPKIRAMDLMEVAPPLDIQDLTSKVGAEVLMNFLCGLCSRKS